MKYYEVTYSPKSHCDAPSPTFHSVIAASDNTSKERQLKRIVHGCEDWQVREISKDCFMHYYE